MKKEEEEGQFIERICLTLLKIYLRANCPIRQPRVWHVLFFPYS